MQVIDVAKDPYGQRHYGKQKRKDFEKLKRSAEFKKWRAHQLKIQNGQCAYCRISLSRKNIVTHVDHIQPLRFDGTNNFDNLVLSCRRCNVRKWIATNRVQPSWVKKRKVHLEEYEKLTAMRKQQALIYREVVTQEIEEQIGYELGQMF